jgi:hypothetical protein
MNKNEMVPYKKKSLKIFEIFLTHKSYLSLCCMLMSNKSLTLFDDVKSELVPSSKYCHFFKLMYQF